MSLFETVVGSPLTLSGLALASLALVVTSFARGWIVSAFQVRQLLSVQNLRIEEAVKRGDDWQTAYKAEAEAHAVTRKQVDQLQVVATTVDRILNALPVPKRQGTP